MVSAIMRTLKLKHGRNVIFHATLFTRAQAGEGATVGTSLRSRKLMHRFESHCGGLLLAQIKSCCKSEMSALRIFSWLVLKSIVFSVMTERFKASGSYINDKLPKFCVSDTV
jgi:hypothetical protein